VNALAGEVPRVRHQPAEWRAVLASASQALQRAELGTTQHPALVDYELSRQLRELREFIQAEEKDRRMVVRLDEILYRWSDIEPGSAGYATVDRLPEYEQAFRDYGIPPVTMTPVAASRLIAERPVVVRDRLLAALYAWHMIRGGQPDNSQELVWLGELLAALRPDPWQAKVVSAAAARDRAALEALAMQADLGAHSPRLLDQLAGSLVRENAQQAAIDLLRRTLIHRSDDFWLNHNLASLLSGADPPQTDEAIRYFTAAAALRPDDAGVLCNLGVHLHRAARVDEATRFFRRAIELNPKLALSHTNLANILWEQGDLDGAASHCRLAIEVAPKLPVAHFSLGIALSRKGDLPGAVAAYRKALELKPDYVEVHANLGSALQRQGDSKNAIAAFRQAIELNPRFALARNNLGVALAASGENELAAAEFREAVALEPAYAQAWCGLGLTLRDLGRFEEALAALRRSRELGGQKNWAQPLDQWVAELNRLVELDHRLLAARKSPGSASSRELVEFAHHCFLKHQFGQSATFWRLAFAAEATPAMGASLFDAARAAALAGCGKGCDDPPLDAATRAGWRQQAVQWLQTELAARKQRPRPADPSAKQAPTRAPAHWQTNRDLAGLRDEASIARLPPDEQAACRALWAELAELVAQDIAP
jgi:tetratricopeptide (TPR) repeat protein